MHPREHTLSPHQRRRTDAELRRDMRQPLEPQRSTDDILAEIQAVFREDRSSRGESLPEGARTPFLVHLKKSGRETAFTARPGIGSTIRTATDIAVTFGADREISFAAGAGVRLRNIQAWKPGERIIIALDKVWTTPDYCLVALSQSEASAAGLILFMLGGFQLDDTGAALADSFYDITAAQLPDLAPCARFEAMVTLLVENKNRGYATDLDDLKAAGLADAALLARLTEATEEAERRTADRDIADDRDPVESAHMTRARMAVAIGELLPSRQFIVTELACRGFTKAQMDAFLRSAIDDAGMAFSGIGQRRVNA